MKSVLVSMIPNNPANLMVAGKNIVMEVIQ